MSDDYMNEIQSFTFFRTYHDSLKELSDEDRKELLVAIDDYVFEDIKPNFTGIKNALWSFIILSLDTSKKRSIVRTKSNQEENENTSNEEQKEIKQKSKQNQNEIKTKSNQEENENIKNNHNLIPNHNLNLKSKSFGKEYEKNLLEEFELLWDIYPNKKSKDQAKQKYLLARKQGATYEEVRQGLESYIKYCEVENIEKKYIKHGSTWFNQKSWNDDYTISRKPNSNDIAKVIDWEDYNKTYGN